MLTKLLELTKRLWAALGLTWTGLVKTITEMAEEIAIKLNLLKLNLKMFELENQLESTYCQLGRAFSHLSDGSISQSKMDNEIGILVARIQQLSENRKTLERMLMDFDEEAFLYPLNEFLKRYKNAGGTVELITISPRFASTEKKIKDLGLPSGTLVIGLQHHDQVLIPSGDTSIYPGDRLLMFSPVQQLGGLRKMFEPVSTEVGDKL